ncbi:MAG: YceD family protein [Hyphomicrobiaceae bacterium]
MDAILDWRHETRTIPEAGIDVSREATAEMCAALAEALGVDACARLVARYTVKPFESGRFEVHGTAEMDARQTCVVTLEPIERTYRVRLDVAYWPPELLGDGPGADIDTLADDPEPIEDGRIDVGRVIYEELASTIDAFPRRGDAAFAWHDEQASTRDNPFAALERLRRRGD